MSQEKVDRYKKDKSNRKQIMRREKRNRVLAIILTVVIVVGALSWFGVSVYQNGQPEEEVYVETTYTAVESYLNGLSYE